jgi:hypothetical protein
LPLINHHVPKKSEIADVDLQLFFLFVCDAIFRIVVGVLDHTNQTLGGLTWTSEWSVCRRSRYLHNTQQTHETNIHALSGIRTYDPNNQAAADLPHRPQVHLRRFHDSWLLQFMEMSCRLPRPPEPESVIAASFR